MGVLMFFRNTLSESATQNDSDGPPRSASVLASTVASAYWSRRFWRGTNTTSFPAPPSPRDAERRQPRQRLPVARHEHPQRVRVARTKRHGQPLQKRSLPRAQPETG